MVKRAVLDDTIVLGLVTPRKGKRAYHYDEELPGFGVAVTDKGTKTFIYYRKIGGSPKRITLGHFPEISVEMARQRARETESGIESSVVPAEEIDREPKEIAVPAPPDPRRRMFYVGMGALATMLCIVVVAILGAAFLSHWKSDEALQSLISFAIDDHLNHQEVGFRSKDPAEIKKVLRRQLPFEVEVPRIDPDFSVVGGRAYKVGANSVAYSLWNAKNANVYSLIQFRRADFGVDAADSPQRVSPQDMAVKHTPCEVLYWSKGEYGFVLVADHGELLDGVAPKIDSINTAQAPAPW